MEHRRGRGLIAVGMVAISGQCRNEVGMSRLTTCCRIFSILLNFTELGCCMSVVKCRFVMVKLRVNGTRARTETVVKLRKKISHPESLPVLNLEVRGRGLV